MIRFEAVSKRFSPQGKNAVDGLELAIAAGEICVLVGPSGCGKTTSLRMINRLEAPSEGRILVAGRDVAHAEVTGLRRGMGYVMQHAGLFPHRRVAANIATVPRLLGWDARRIAARVESLVELVGLDPALLTRFPRQLSGGQQSRVGLARALAADPPILLMDEPFAAIDPVVRARLQLELLDLQRKLRKTLVLVTHDIDEAIRLGDRIAVLRDGGRLAQFDTPARLLAAPADDFVADFLGPERELKRLSLLRVADLAPNRWPAVSEAQLARADAAVPWRVVIDAAGRPSGWLSAAGERIAPGALLRADDSLRNALATLVESPPQALLRIDTEGRYDGVVTLGELRGALKSALREVR